MAEHHDKSGSKSRGRTGGKKDKRPHRDAAKLSGRAPTAEQVARWQGTAPMVGGAARRTGTRVPREPGLHSIDGQFYLVGERVHVSGGGIVAQRTNVVGGARLVLDRDPIVQGEVTVGDGGTIEARRAFLGDTLVDDTEIAARAVAGVSTAHIASADRAIISAIGNLRDKFEDQERVGDAIARFLGGRHRVVPEKRGEAGAVLRDGTCDDQVDVFLRAEHPTDDLKLQVVVWSEFADQLGAHGAAIEIVFDDEAIRKVIRSKSQNDGIDSLDLVISLPVGVPAPMRQALGPRFDTLGYSRVWLVDAEGWSVVLGRRAG